MVRSVAGWARRQPVAVDALLVAVLAVAVGPQLAFHVRTSDPQWPLYVLLSAGLLLPLIFRRTAPLTVFAVIVVVAGLQWVLGLPLAADVSVLIALYTVATRFALRTAVLAGGVVEIGALLAAGRWPHGLSAAEMAFVLTVFVLAAVMTGAYVRDRRRTIEALRAQAEHLRRERDQQARLAAAEERNRIAREMHDIIAHSLAIMITLADAAAGKVQTDPDRARGVLRQLAGTGRATLDEARQLVGVLRTDPLAPTTPPPSVRDLPELVERIRDAGLTASLTVTGDPEAVPAASGLAAYRIAQEALTNAVKHAVRPTRATLTVEISPTATLLTVRDDGRAAGRRSGPAGNGLVGHGLVGMRERAAMGHGTLVAGPDPTGGWTVRARLPHAPADAGRA